MRVEGYNRMEEGCSDSLLPHPGTHGARSGSHDWHKG